MSSSRDVAFALLANHLAVAEQVTGALAVLATATASEVRNTWDQRAVVSRFALSRNMCRPTEAIDQVVAVNP